MKYTLYGGPDRRLDFVTKLAIECHDLNIELLINGNKFDLSIPAFTSIITDAIKNNENKPGHLEIKPKDSASILIGLETGYKKEKKQFNIGDQLYPENEVNVIAIGRTSENIFYSNIGELDPTKLHFYEDEQFAHSVLQFILKHPADDKNFEKSNDSTNKKFQKWHEAMANHLHKVGEEAMGYLTKQGSFATTPPSQQSTLASPDQVTRCNVM